MRQEKTCNEFEAVREAIDAEDYNGIIKGLVVVCRKCSKLSKDYLDDFEELADEIEVWADDDVEEECIDYYLDEVYDLCDAARIWLGV